MHGLTPLRARPGIRVVRDGGPALTGSRAFCNLYCSRFAGVLVPGGSSSPLPRRLRALRSSAVRKRPFFWALLSARPTTFAKERGRTRLRRPPFEGKRQPSNDSDEQFT